MPFSQNRRYTYMIEFNDVVKTYEQGNNALNGVTMQIEDGEFCFLVGPSGSGKSTIIKMITGELKPTSGTVHVNGYSLDRIRKREIPYLRRTVGVVFQDFRLINKMTVAENVAFAMRVIGAREREIKACPTRKSAIPASCPAASSRDWPLPGPW